MNPARLLIPALRANPDGGFHQAAPAATAALERGVGGFILFGGTVDEVRSLTTSLRRAAPHPLLIGSDLERGTGQQFSGATSLPPPAALGYLGDLAVTRRAGFVTGAETVALGVDWVFAPVADLDVEPENPIVGTRAFGGDAAAVARHVAAWVEGCEEAGALACAKHFPGHGRTRSDSHIEVGHAIADESTLRHDLLPFRSAIQAGVSSLMTAHVAFPALDPSGSVATVSRPILNDLLRHELGFSGLVVSDALSMAGVSGGRSEGEAAVAALAAGCDLLLYPEHPDAVIATLEQAISRGILDPGRVEQSNRRLDAALARRAARSAPSLEPGSAEPWAAEIARRCLFVLRGEPAFLPEQSLIVIDDDQGGPFPGPSREVLRAGLEGWLAGERVTPNPSPIVALFSDPRAWKGRAALSEATRNRVAEMCDVHPDACVLLFAHPRLADEIPRARHVVCAWGGDPVMQRAAAAWVTARGRIHA